MKQFLALSLLLIGLSSVCAQNPGSGFSRFKDIYATANFSGNAVNVTGDGQLAFGFEINGSAIWGFKWDDATGIHLKGSVRYAEYLDFRNDDIQRTRSVSIGLGANDRDMVFGTVSLNYDLDFRKRNAVGSLYCFPWSVNKKLSPGFTVELGTVNDHAYGAVGFILLFNPRNL